MKKSLATIALAALLTVGVAPAAQALDLPTFCPKGTHAEGRFCIADKPDPRYIPRSVISKVAKVRVHLMHR